MIYKKFSKGFTLIELLVVISIIGLLSSVVLASLNTARVKAIDASVKANMQSVRTIAEIYYDTNGSYGAPLTSYDPNANPCSAVLSNMFSDPRVRQAISASNNAVGINASQCAIGPNGQSWALSVSLRGGGSWCVSSSGQPKIATAFADALNTAFCDDGL